MGRVIAIAAVFAVGFIALLVWILTGAQDQIETRDQVTKDGGKSLKKGRRPSTDVTVPKDRPRGAAHVLLELRLPGAGEDAARRHGGPVLLQLRGNGVAYKRTPAQPLRWERVAVPRPAVDDLLAAAGALPPDGGGEYRVVLDLGKGRSERPVGRRTALELLGMAAGRARPWTPAEIVLRTRIGDGPGEGLPPWPESLQAPEDYAGEGASCKAPRRVMKALLAAAGEPGSLAHEGRAVVVASFDVVIP